MNVSHNSNATHMFNLSKDRKIFDMLILTYFYQHECPWFQRDIDIIV